MNSPKWENTFKMNTICKNFLPNGRVLSHLGENLPSWACAPTAYRQSKKIQKRAARFVTGNYNRETSSSSMVQKLGWKPLEDRRTRARLTTIYKETHGLIPNNIDRFTHKGCHQTRRLRLHGKFSYETPKFSKDCLKYSLYPRTIPEWNLLPDCVKTAPNLDKFKAVLSNMDVCSLVNKAHFKI